MADNESKYNDSSADALAAVVIISIVVVVVSYWLASMPS